MVRRCNIFAIFGPGGSWQDTGFRMFSLQTIFGKGDKFYGLLESSAAAARESARALGELLATPSRSARSW